MSQWGHRDDTRPQPEVRHAANTVMDALEALCSRLVSEIRASDQASEARLDALLRRDGTSCAPAAGMRPVQPAPVTGHGRTSDRAVWRVYKRGLLLTVTRLAGGGWQPTVEGPGVTERSPMPFRTRKHAQAWADNRAGGRVMTGHYETEQQVRELPAVRAIYDAMRASHRHGVMGEQGYRLLDEAGEAASVKVGAYDHCILIWLAGLEPEACAVDAGLITREHQAETAVTGEHAVTLTAAQAAAVRRALADAEVYCRQRAAAWYADCDSLPVGECTDHMDDLEAADACRDLAAGLAPVGAEPPEGGRDV